MIKDWQHHMTTQLNMALNSADVQFKYLKPRKCLKVLCQFEAEDAAEMFQHIREKHVKMYM